MELLKVADWESQKEEVTMGLEIERYFKLQEAAQTAIYLRDYQSSKRACLEILRGIASISEEFRSIHADFSSMDKPFVQFAFFSSYRSGFDDESRATIRLLCQHGLIDRKRAFELVEDETFDSTQQAEVLWTALAKEGVVSEAEVANLVQAAADGIVDSKEFAIEQAAQEARIVDAIRQNPGILQTDLYKLLIDIPAGLLSSDLYSLASLGKIVRGKHGRSYTLSVAV